ncbi:[Cytochrome c]-lysine N-methyltransferase [Nakaseomyces glabratus]
MELANICNATTAKGIAVQKDSYGGYGVYIVDPGALVGCNDPKLGGDKIELLRVSSVFNVKNLMEAMNALEGEYAEDGQRAADMFKSIIGSSIEELSAVSETCLLVYFMMVIYLMGEQGYAVPMKISRYIDTVLLGTTVNNASNCIESMLIHYEHVALFHELDNNLQKLHKTLISKMPSKKNYSIELLRQIYSATVSRVLEIPQELHEENYMDNYVVTPSLVPILDYVNHGDKTSRNAYYDVDRRKGDIILYLDLTVVNPGKLKPNTEVLITYKDIEDSLAMITKYGFDPANYTTTGTKIFSCTFDKIYLSTNKFDNEIDIRNFYQWFSINPSLQFVLNSENEWLINDSLAEFERLLVPFATSSQRSEHYWIYSDGDDARKRFMEYFDVDEVDDEDEAWAQLETQFKWFESSENDLMPFPPCVWTVKSKFLKEKEATGYELEKVIQNKLETSRALYNETTNQFQAYLENYLDYRIDVLQEYSPEVTENENAVSQLIARELSVLLKIRDRINNNKSIFLNSEDKKYAKLPLLPTKNVERPPWLSEGDDDFDQV